MNIKYVKVIHGTTSGANKDLEYKIDEVNIANNWNPNASDPKDMGGFNFSTEESILRWLIRGDTLYDVIIPEDAEVIKCDNPSTPNGVFRTNKIILKNPKKVDDRLALDLYYKSNIPEKSYYKALAGCMIRGYKNTCYQIIKDKVNKDNIDVVLNEINDFVFPENASNSGDIECFNEIMEILNEIKSDLDISVFIDKDPYIKDITNDKIINITGESGSGKSTYAKQYLDSDDYIVIDTDEIFNYENSNNKDCIEFGTYLKNKYSKNVPKDCKDFDILYQEILEYYKDIDKTLVIDSAQYRNLVNKGGVDLIKGKLIVIRASIDNCYIRCINRWKEKNKEYTDEEYLAYAKRKKGMYNWYKLLNKFINEVENGE